MSADFFNVNFLMFFPSSLLSLCLSLSLSLFVFLSVCLSLWLSVSISLSLALSALLFPSWLVLFCSFPYHLCSRSTFLHLLTYPACRLHHPFSLDIFRPLNPSFICVCVCLCLGGEGVTHTETAPVTSWTHRGCHDMELMLSCKNNNPIWI